MTKQNMVVPETETAIDIEHVVSKSAHFFTASTLKPPSGRGGGIITISRNKHVKNNSDSNHGARITSWVDSMRASSPTHPNSAAMFLPQTANQHPSALDKFDQIISAAKGKQIVMFLDYDGTLSPIIDDPDRAFMSDAMRDTVRRVAKYFPTAIVSGRCLDKVYGFVKLAELYYAGSHGMDIKGPTKGSKCNKSSVVFQPATEFVPMIDQAYKALVEMTKSIPGANVEHNKFCVSVHFRCVDEKRWSDIAQGVREILKDYPRLRLSQGRKVLEIRPTIKWDKGKALEFLLESLGFANCADVFPIYIGDDRTDEDAFKVLRELGQGIGILVSKFSKETCASYSLQEPSEVMSFLQRLAGWKRMSSRPKLGFRVKNTY